MKEPSKPSTVIGERSLQECKDQVAIKHCYDTWDTLCPNGNLDGVPDEWVNEVAELYASQFKQPALIGER